MIFRAGAEQIFVDHFETRRIDATLLRDTELWCVCVAQATALSIEVEVDLLVSNLLYKVRLLAQDRLFVSRALRGAASYARLDVLLDVDRNESIFLFRFLRRQTFSVHQGATIIVLVLIRSMRHIMTIIQSRLDHGRGILETQSAEGSAAPCFLVVFSR